MDANFYWGVNMKMLKCDCGHVIRGRTESEIMKKGGVHMKKVHPGMKLTAAAVKKLKASIKNVKK